MAKINIKLDQLLEAEFAIKKLIEAANDVAWEARNTSTEEYKARLENATCSLVAAEEWWLETQKDAQIEIARILLAAADVIILKGKS